MQKGSPQSRHAVVLFTDIVESTAPKGRIGTPTYTAMLVRHNEPLAIACQNIRKTDVLKHTGEGFFAAFPTASDAVRVATGRTSQSSTR